MPASHVQRFGPSALFIALSTTPESSFLAVQQLIVALEALPLFGVREMVRGYTTLLVEFTAAEFCSDALLDRIKECVESVGAGEKLVAPVETRLIDVPVCYDGPDLERVAQHAGLTTAEVIGFHTGGLCQVHFLGFAPGFPYLSGLDTRLATPRLITPRPRVSPGSVGIGGNQTGIYSVATPGGWNLIGRTSLPLFSPQAVAGEQMFLFRPGDRVRFVAVDELEQPPKLETTPTHRELGSPILKVLRNGAGITLQDAGRPGWKRYGVPEG
ncbi:MAG TPA: 5-oxoprolinase subunit PxpB, partial [Candidatus Limnocylindria bacterium]|nr:5-oxoprolinase subunit PxpB [Candidatus Limnocylindria bacterium]